ncbi:MAG: phage major capsid protein [Rickettsiales bacterium]
MLKQLRAAQKRKAELVAEAKALLPEGDAEMGAEAEAKFDALEAKIQAENAKISRLEKLVEEERNSPAATYSDEAETAAGLRRPAADANGGNNSLRVAVGNPRIKPFANLGEQLIAVYNATVTGNRIYDERLQQVKAAVSGASEGVGSDGGFLVQSDFASTILMKMFEVGDILARCYKVPISSNSNRLIANAVDETSRANGSRFGGVRAYWEGEGDAGTGAKPKFRQIDMTLKKLFGLYYATDELLQDASAFSRLAEDAFRDEMVFSTEDAIVEGDGSNKPLGYMNSPALITVAKESGQAAATIVLANIVKMWARMPARSKKSAVWLVNTDVIPQLQLLTLGDRPMYLEAGIRGNAEPLLLGRPVIEVEYCESVGTVGDIALVDLSRYMLIDKDGIQFDSSMHVKFEQGEQTFRMIYRVNGQPMNRSAITPFKGSNTLSPFVVLATRS